MIDSLFCKIDNTLLSALKIINDNAMGAVFVVDDNYKLYGVITDGDIRRSILNDISLYMTAGDIVSSNSVYGLDNENYESIMKKITHNIKIIPIVDKNNKVVDYFEYRHEAYFPAAIPNLNGNEFKYLTDAFLSSWISSKGEYLHRFESGFSKYSDCQYGVSVSNGTVALHLALIALGVGYGDEVIVPDLTFAATINAVIHANATPVIVDIEENSWCIDPKSIEVAITNKTKVIIPVHIYGQPCDMDAIMGISEKYNLRVIEDCAEAHGAMYGGKKVGCFGDIGCFSFYGNKVITTGEGGMCVTSSEEIYQKMAVLRDHGMSKTKRYWHDIVGYNYRMTNLHAAIGLAQLERIESIHKNRKKYENTYREVLNKDICLFQNNLTNRGRITWLVSILLNKKINVDSCIILLREKGIDARPFFYPLSDMPIYSQYCNKKTSVAHKISERGINLPTYENLKSINEIKKIIEDVNCELKAIINV